MSKRAFTLIELVVVVSIIALLASVVVVQTASAELRARDNKRISDIVNLQSSLELYYSKYRNYPAFFFNVSGCSSNYVGYFDARIQLDANYLSQYSTGATCTTFNPRLAPEFINAVATAPKAPADPRQYPRNPFDGYYYIPNSLTAPASKYVLCTALEDATRVNQENKMDSYIAGTGQSDNNPPTACNYQVHSPGW